MADLEERRAFGSGFSCSCNSRLSSIWSESNEEKSLDFETSSSGSEDSEEMNFIGDQREGGDFSSCEKGVCSSPFRFVLQNSWSPGRRTPEFASPATSPGRLRRQALQKDEGDLDCSRKGFEEEEKDQNSPVSVLDPPFEDDDNQGHQDGGEGEGKHDEFELEHSFAIAQRARHKLLNKLRQFERVAELDPVELEKKMVEDVEDEDISEYVYHSSDLSGNKKGDEASIGEVLTQSDLYSCRRIPQDMKRLVLDLMAEEESADTDPNSTNTVKRVCERLEAWKEVEMNTIDMMVELDFRKQAEEWKKNVEQVQEVAVAIELAILGFLMEELSNELAQSS